MSKIKIIGDSIPNLPWQEKPSDCKDPVWRFAQNPVIDRNPCEGVARIFNSAVVPYEGKFIGLFRVEEKTGVPYVRLGRSDDGMHFTFEEKHLEVIEPDGSIAPDFNHYDPRLVKIEDAYYGIWCEPFLTAKKYPSLGICKTTDFKTFHRVPSPLLPAQRNGVLFPRKVNGEYKLFSRPSDLSHTTFGDIFISGSKDMEYWGNHACVLQTQECGCWAGCKIGAGPAPIETSEGWLMFYHGVQHTCNCMVYSMGACLLDLNDPSKVLYNCSPYLLTPEKTYEQNGFVPNVVFPCAALADADTGRIAIYYGGADSVTCLAFTTVDELVEYIKTHCDFKMG